MGKDIIKSRNNIIKNQNINKIYSLTNFVMKYSLYRIHFERYYMLSKPEVNYACGTVTYL